MKLVCAVIKPYKLDEVKNALANIGVEGMTVSEVKGFGRQQGHAEIYRGSEYTVDFTPKIMIMVVVENSLAEAAQQAIERGARTGKIGDGKMWCSDVDSVVRIRTGERITDGGIQLSDSPGPAARSRTDDQKATQEAAPSAEHSATKLRLIKTLTKLGYTVTAPFRVKRSLVDFRLEKDNQIILAMYRPEATSKVLNYLYSVGGEKRDERVIICDGLRREVEEECDRLGIKYWTIDTLETLKYKYARRQQKKPVDKSLRATDVRPTIQFHGPVSGSVQVGATNATHAISLTPHHSNSDRLLVILDELKEILAQFRTMGAVRAECNIAEEALSALRQISSQVDEPEFQHTGKRAFTLLKGVAGELGKFGDLGGRFGKLVDLIAPVFHSCFISYSHVEKAFARILHDRLQEQGIRCWKDDHQLLPGDDLHEGIDRGIRLWDKVLLCASKSSLTSWWVDGEINRSFQKEAQLMKERGKKVLALIPLNLDGFLFSDDYQSGKKSEIKSRVAANFVGWEKDHALFDRELEKVIRALRTDDAGREKAPRAML